MTDAAMVGGGCVLITRERRAAVAADACTVATAVAGGSRNDAV